MKLKRLFTAVLSAALALSLCAMPAMAADDTTTPVKTSTSTIDKGQTGSLSPSISAHWMVPYQAPPVMAKR